MEQDERSLIEHHFSMLREIFDAIDDMIFVAKSDGCSFRYIWANKAACRTIGMDNVTGKRFEDVLSPERAAKIKENYKQAAQMKTTITYEDEMETSNGWKHYETVLTPLDGEGDWHRWFVAVVRDVTERKMKERELQKMKEQLEASRKRYKTFLEHLPGGVLVFNQEGMVIYANISAVQLLGAKQKSDIVGIPMRKICRD
ncbi:hypothetical protein M493_07530 [Geobacillus genomosp. 3]|uniref:PAS domain S-box protein n=1 Tax=Geobacillus genomosp. 3 TaxID=1921421 RepID=S6A1I1_GEOG3|nr:PAS domain-containing protein [Geobacillus genomosp. 3]AGT31791.1 hypothetical protein M493_07530 [Geobacillus genomosp. 3]